ncbi:MAG TPA: hypothetical protein VGI23_06215, partial [Steroidobacteraceae bacterium]
MSYYFNTSTSHVSITGRMVKNNEDTGSKAVRQPPAANHPMPANSRKRSTAQQRSTPGTARQESTAGQAAASAAHPLLNRDSATALYMQIADRLRTQIDEGTFATDSKLPAESELTRR